MRGYATLCIVLVLNCISYIFRSLCHDRKIGKTVRLRRDATLCIALVLNCISYIFRSLCHDRKIGKTVRLRRGIPSEVGINRQTRLGILAILS
jgi:hypothetical protein